MKVVNMHDAKSSLSKLVEKALSGEQVFISKRGNIIIQLTPIKETSKKRTGRQWKNQVSIEKDFDTLPPEISEVLYS